MGDRPYRSVQERALGACLILVVCIATLQWCVQVILSILPVLIGLVAAGLGIWGAVILWRRHREW